MTTQELKDLKEMAERNLLKAHTAHIKSTQELCDSLRLVNLNSNKFNAIRPQIDSYLKQFEVKVLQYTQEVENLERKLYRRYREEKSHVYQPFAKLNRQLAVL